MLNTAALSKAIDRAGRQTRRHIRAGHFDAYQGQVRLMMTDADLFRELERAVTAALVEAAGLPKGCSLHPIQTTEGWQLAIGRPPRNGRTVR